MTTEHQIWTTDNDGRDILVATTRIGSDAGVVFEAVRDACSFVEWRMAAHGQHRGRLFRGWDGEKREMYGPAENAIEAERSVAEQIAALGVEGPAAGDGQP